VKKKNTTKNKAKDVPESRRMKYYHWSDFFLSIDMFGAAPSLEVRGRK